MTSEEINQITIKTVDQGDDPSGGWIVQHCGRVTDSTFGDIVRRKAAYAPLVARLLYSKSCRTKVMITSHALVVYTVIILTNSIITGHLWKKQDFRCVIAHINAVLDLSTSCSLTGWVHHQMT